MTFSRDHDTSRDKSLSCDDCVMWSWHVTWQVTKLWWLCHVIVTRHLTSHVVVMIVSCDRDTSRDKSRGCDDCVMWLWHVTWQVTWLWWLCHVVVTSHVVVMIVSCDRDTSLDQSRGCDDCVTWSRWRTWLIDHWPSCTVYQTWRLSVLSAKRLLATDVIHFMTCVESDFRDVIFMT